MARAEENVGLVEEGEVVLWEASTSATTAPSRSVAKAVALSLGAAALFAGGVAIGMAAVQPAPQKASVGESVGLGGFGDMLDSMRVGLNTFSNAADETQSAQQGIQTTMSEFGKPWLEAEAVLADKPSLNETNRLKNLSGWDLVPRTADRKNGNPCPDDEEHLAGLCYKRCSDINGTFPIRTTAFACCRAKPCGIFNTKHTSPLKMCMGNDVAGDREGGGCPHTPGACLRNEEYFLGVCYKKCSLVAGLNYSFRTSPSTCCKYKTKVACMDAMNTMVSATYNVGGGINDILPDFNATYSSPHGPVIEFAEKQNKTTSLPTLPPPPATLAPVALPTLPAVVAPVAPVPPPVQVPVIETPPPLPAVAPLVAVQVPVIETPPPPPAVAPLVA